MLIKTALALALVVGTAAGDGYLTMWAGGATRPGTTNMVWGGTVGRFSSLSVTPLSSTATVSVSSSKTTDIVVDVLGYFAPGTAGLKYHAFPSVSLLDTSVTHTFIPAGGSTTASPPAAMGADAAMVAVLTASADVGGNLSAFPDVATAPDTSTLSYRTTGGISNLAIVPGGTGGAVKLTVSGSVQVWVSMSSNGYFAGA